MTERANERESTGERELRHIKFRVRPELEARWKLAAKARGLPLATWIRRVCTEETERQAAFLLYQIRVERPHELNAVVEELLRRQADQSRPLDENAKRELLRYCEERKRHKRGRMCDWCQQIP